MGIDRDVLTVAETEEGLWGCTVGRTGEADKTSLHCDWAASAGAGTTTKPSKRAKLHRMPKVGQSGGAAGWSWGGKAKILLAKTGWGRIKKGFRRCGPVRIMYHHWQTASPIREGRQG